MTHFLSFNHEKTVKFKESKHLLLEGLHKLHEESEAVRNRFVSRPPIDTMDASDLLHNIEELEVHLKECKAQAKKIYKMFS